MALSVILFRRILLMIVAVGMVLPATAQTFRLYLAESGTNATKSIVIDSTTGPFAGPVFDPERPVIYYSKGGEVNAFNVDTGNRQIIFKSNAPVHALRVSPDGKTLTFLNQVPANELKRIRLDGAGASARTIPVSVENYVWIDDNNLLAIEPGKPNTLHLITLRPVRHKVVARHVGNTLTHNAKSASFAFVHKLAVDSWSIKTIGSDGTISILAETLPESDVFAVTSTGTPVAYYDQQLHRYNERTSDWFPIDLEIQGTLIDMHSSPADAKLAYWVKSNH